MNEEQDQPTGRYDHLDVRVYPQEKKRASIIASATLYANRLGNE